MTARVVSLVGAGPGDPGLLTRRAVQRLRHADLVLYDALVSREVLKIARRAQCFCVGKRAGRKAMRQETIHQLMIRAVRRGKRVVRLKGGDPFVLGRGGEEALALRAAGVAFEVVPGVTTAVAAPGLAGIPVTHRGLASAFLVVSGPRGVGVSACARGARAELAHRDCADGAGVESGAREAAAGAWLAPRHAGGDRVCRVHAPRPDVGWQTRRAGRGVPGGEHRRAGDARHW